MKLSAWAKEQGLCYRTAWRMWKMGKLPVYAEQLPTGTVIVHQQPIGKREGVALYARVSSMDQKTDLDRQLARLAEFAAKQGFYVAETIKEIGSGLNGHRKSLLRIFKNAEIKTIIVEHRDRLVRFGFEYLEAALAANGRKIVVIEQDEITDDIVRDLHEVIVSMCARLYGKRSAKNRAEKAIKVITT